MNKKEIKYSPKYGVIIICKDEEEQKKVFEKLKNQGIKSRVVCV